MEGTHDATGTAGRGWVTLAIGATSVLLLFTVLPLAPIVGLVAAVHGALAVRRDAPDQRQHLGGALLGALTVLLVIVGALLFLPVDAGGATAGDAVPVEGPVGD